MNNLDHRVDFHLAWAIQIDFQFSLDYHRTINSKSSHWVCVLWTHMCVYTAANYLTLDMGPCSSQMSGEIFHLVMTFHITLSAHGHEWTFLLSPSGWRPISALSSPPRTHTHARMLTHTHTHTHTQRQRVLGPKFTQMSPTCWALLSLTFWYWLLPSQLSTTYQMLLVCLTSEMCLILQVFSGLNQLLAQPTDQSSCSALCAVSDTQTHTPTINTSASNKNVLTS